MPNLMRSRVALISAAPALLVPAIEIPLIIWARQQFVARHPDFVADEPPTISRAISDPMIGGPFAALSLLITALILVTLAVLARAYLQAIGQLPLTAAMRRLMKVLLALFLVLQLAALAGMVLTTQVTLTGDEPMHMLGSYILFVAQGLAILLAATLCRLLLGQQRKHGIGRDVWPFHTGMHRFRFRFALIILLLTAVYGVLFVIKDQTLPIGTYAVHTIYTQWEMLVVGCYVLFLGSYAIDIRSMVQAGKLTFRPGWTPPGGRDRA